MNIHNYRYLQHSPRWPLVEGRPVAPRGAEPGHRAGGTHQPHPPETPQRTAKGKLWEIFYFLFCKTRINSTNGWACLDMIYDTEIIYSLFLHNFFILRMLIKKFKIFFKLLDDQKIKINVDIKLDHICSQSHR